MVGGGDLGNKKQASEGLALLACLDFSPGYLVVMTLHTNTTLNPSGIISLAFGFATYLFGACAPK
jgi:hypothetical protein